MDADALADLSCDGGSSDPASRTPPVPRDARAARSSRSLRQALLALIERKPLEQITVREIAVEAGVHYATFFRHHASKEALLDHLAAEEIERLVDLTLPALDADGGLSSITKLCGYVDAHRTLWTAFLTGGAAATMRAEFLRISRAVAAERAPDESWLPVTLAVNCSVGLIFETLAWWLGPEGDAVPIPAVAAVLHRLVSSLNATPAGDGNVGF